MTPKKTKRCPSCRRRFKSFLLSGISTAKGQKEILCETCVRERVFGPVVASDAASTPAPQAKPAPKRRKAQPQGE